MRPIERNIPLLYLIKVCKWFMLYMPVIKIFYEENGFNNYELFLLHGIYSVVIALLEIPSGYIADQWGKKRALVLGLGLGVVGFASYSVSFGFWGFLLAELSLGIGQAFISGTDSALLYDSLQMKKRSDQYLKHESRITGVGNFSEGIAGITVTLLAFEYMRPYFYWQTILTLIGLVVSFFLIEPKISHKTGIEKSSILKILKISFFQKKILGKYLVFSSIIAFSSVLMAWFSLIFLYEAGISDAKMGVYWTVLNVVVALGSFMAHKTYQYLGKRNALIFILLFMSVSYGVIAQFINMTGILLLVIFYWARGVAHPILKERINYYASSDKRATVLSIRSFGSRIMFFTIGPLLGWVSDKYTLSLALFMAGWIILIPGIVFLTMILNAERKN